MLAWSALLWPVVSWGPPGALFPAGRIRPLGRPTLALLAACVTRLGLRIDSMIQVALKPGRTAQVWTDEHPPGIAFAADGYETTRPAAASGTIDGVRTGGVEISLQTGGTTHYAYLGGV